MLIPPVFTITSEMLESISKIDAQRIYFSTLSLPLPLKEKIQRVSLLKSSLFSARIEGNTLEISDLSKDTSQSDKKREVFNIVDGVKFIDTDVKMGETITRNIFLELHSRVLKDIRPDAGSLRSEMSAIFNQAGVAVYIPPSPTDISKLVDQLLEYINSNDEKFPLLTAFISHLIFEKIHAFLDGNGRVGRLLIALVLKAKGWDFTFTVPFEEYLDQHKDEYYFHLDRGMKNTNEYLFFMLDAFFKEIEEIKKQVDEGLIKKDQPFLPPRQDEIYNIIKDHTSISFDMIRRRFLQVPERTLRYDLKKLVDADLIEKSGETRGRYYRVKEK